MAVDDENPNSPMAAKPNPKPVYRTSPAVPTPEPNGDGKSPNKPQSPKEFILSVANKFSSQPLSNPDRNVWGVLTAISKNARKRQQGINMLLTSNEHCVGRLVGDSRFQIESTAVSGNHCKLYRKNAPVNDADPTKSCSTVFLKDTSTNGTFLNWKKLSKSSPEAKVQHGDIVSFAAPPQHELALAFVYREVVQCTPSMEGAAGKRKGEEIILDSKRLKGIGIGAPEGPICLDDFRRLQRSNTELRKQLESQVLTIDALRNEHQAIVDRHENEVKEVKEAVTKVHLDQLKELQQMLDDKQKELTEVCRISAEQKHSLEELDERLNASKQSIFEANEIIKSQKASMLELEAQLEEEREQRKEERQKAVSDLKAAIQRVQSEAQEEFKRLNDTALQRERELHEEINKLQEREKKWCSQIDVLRPKLEEARQKLVLSDNKVRQLEAQVCEEQLASTNRRNRVEELEQEVKILRKELENEKAAREEAWAKVSTLELEINGAMRELEFERRRLRAARERIMLRETQLRAFYSTTEEISVLFAKQQEQLKAMQRTLEDEDNYENTSADFDLNEPYANMASNRVRQKIMTPCHSNSAAKAGSATSPQNQTITSGDEVSATEKHDCDVRSREGEYTQEEEFTSANHQVRSGAFGSDIDGIDTAPVLEGDAVGTEQVPETESPGIDDERNIDLNKCGSLAGETMQLDDEAQVHECDDNILTNCEHPVCHSQSNNPLDDQRTAEDTEPEGTIRTADLLASEVVGSWAYSTAPSVHGENESPRSDDISGKGDEGVHDSHGAVAESQTTPENAITRRDQECRALREMIGIVAPDLKEQFSVAMDCDGDVRAKSSTSTSDTEGCSDTDDDNRECARGGSVSDMETEGSDRVDEEPKYCPVDESNEATPEDSLG